MPIQHFDQIPEQVHLEPKSFLQWLGKTSIIKAGHSSPCLVLFCLIHGNEPSGFYAFQELLKKLYSQDYLQKTVYFVFANVKAALSSIQFDIRFTEDQSDLNRIWENAGKNTEQNQIVEELKQFIKEKKPQLLVDFHNTSGSNPVYLITPPNFDHSLIQKYSYFSTRILEDNDGRMLISWSDKICPSFLIECGKNISPQSHCHAQEILEKVLIFSQAQAGQIFFPEKIQIASNPSTFFVKPGTEITIADHNTGTDLVLRTDLDKYNDQLLPAGFFFGWANKPGIVEHEKMAIIDNQLLLKTEAALILLTTSIPAIQKTCLGYFVDVEEIVLKK